MIPATMRAARYDRYGAPDVLHAGTVDVPTPGPRDVLVRVHGASVNPSDALFRSGRFRLVSGFRFPKGTGIDLVALTRYADAGELRPVVDRLYPLDQVAAAHRAVETGHARGKRVIDLT